MMKNFLLLLFILILNLFFQYPSLAKTAECNSENEGKRIGPYECRNGEWIYVGSEINLTA